MISVEAILGQLDTGNVPELTDVYEPEAIASSRKEIFILLAAFKEQFPDETSAIIVRAPGRVNIIGEHTDYNGYPVLPIALQHDVKIACSPRNDSRVELRNVDQHFGPAGFVASSAIPKSKQGAWDNYVKAAVQGVLEANLLAEKQVHGFNGVIFGTVPESAGLSSSSALTVASALAFLKINNVELDRLKLAELVTHAERYAGLEGGGMDQTISLLGKPGHALKIDFFPLRVREVRIPSGVTFVVCNSLVRAQKSDTVRSAYNQRVVECRLAMALLARMLLVQYNRKLAPQFLRDLSSEAVGFPTEQLASIALHAMGKLPLSLREVSKRLDMDVDTITQRYCTTRDGTVICEPPGGFAVWKRYHHVTTEATRVNQAVDALEHGDVQALGELMNQSHESCRDDYEVSCPELESLVKSARQHGALGSRLTGAGFGGCTVSLVPDSVLDSFVEGVTEDFYKPLGDIPENAMFASRPGSGACILF